MTASKIFVYSEDKQIQQELLGKAQQVGGDVAIAYIGENDSSLTDFSNQGANTVFSVVDPGLKVFNPEIYCDVLAEIITRFQPHLIMMGATKQGLELSARIAERLEISCASWCVDFEIETASQEVIADCMIYSGIGKNTYRLKTQPAMVTVAGGVFEVLNENGAQAKVEHVPMEIQPAKLKVIEQKGKMAAGRRLEDAKVIVDVGQGFKEQKDVGMAEELAGLLGGQVSCTRPVSSDRNWFPDWIGLSGAQLSPDLCFTIGTSGAIQHMVGIRDSKIIVAVNNDEFAGVHYQADFGVVADLYQFLPALMKVIKERSIKLA